MSQESEIYEVTVIFKIQHLEALGSNKTVFFVRSLDIRFDVGRIVLTFPNGHQSMFPIESVERILMPYAELTLNT